MPAGAGVRVGELRLHVGQVAQVDERHEALVESRRQGVEDVDGVVDRNPLQDPGDLLGRQLLEQRQPLRRLHLGQDLAGRVRVVGDQDVEDRQPVAALEAGEQNRDVGRPAAAEQAGDVGLRSPLEEADQRLRERLAAANRRRLHGGSS